MSHKQITQEERYLIQHYLRQGYYQARIARTLGRHRSTICREIHRNVHVNGCYIDYRAQKRANGRRRRVRQGSWFSPAEWSMVNRHLCEDWSPDQIAQRLKQTGQLNISHETIYRHIWREKRSGGLLYRHLRQSSKQKRKRYNSHDSRGILRGKRDITERPESAETRSEPGHAEVDLVHGSGTRDCILTLVDRQTRRVHIRKLKDKNMDEVSRSLIELIRCHDIRTITADNGSEFHDYARVERLTGTTFYFAKPYHSWERGTSENTNGLIRQYLPKRVSMERVTQWDCNAIARQLNSRPRKALNYRTPMEASCDL